MKFVKILLWIVLVLGILVYPFVNEAGMTLIYVGAAALLGIAINEMLNNIRVIRENSDELLKIAKKNAEK